MKEFFQKYSKLIIAVNAAFILAIGVSIFSVIKNVNDINTLKPYLEQYGNNEDGNKSNKNQSEETTVEPTTVDAEIENLQNEVNEKQAALDRVKTIQTDLDALSDEFVKGMTSFPLNTYDEKYLESLKPITTTEVYNIVNEMCENTYTLPKSYKILHRYYSDLDTDEPKVALYCNYTDIYNFNDGLSDNLFILNFTPDSNSEYGYIVSDFHTNVSYSAGVGFYNKVLGS